MNFTLSSEQLQIQQMARDFAQKELAPQAARLDELSEFPSQNIRKLAELGFMGMMIPPEWGGAGFDALSYVLALEEIAVGCASTAGTLSVHNSLFNHLLFTYGNDSQKESYLRPFAEGKKLGAYALTEPSTGSDAAAIQCRAIKKGSSYFITGRKIFITSGPQADAMVLYALTDASKKTKGITAFIVDKNFKGFSIGKIEKKLGLCASSTSEIVLEDCEVPEENILGREGEGFKIAMASLDRGRIGIATQALGIARAAFEAARKYANEREAFGKKIYEFGSIQNYLADMAVKIKASRLMIHEAAWKMSEKMPFAQEASMAKLHASEAAMWVATKAVQVFGGYGYMKDYPVERYFREAKVTEIYEGTSEIQRLVICRNLMREIQ
ncbi:MAG: acyl-CoA dehydrogenase family protein [Deltaproteobacteria bacterium]|nr:acyl-CoA dehydrogenase family protein [Deltaproteobacteria bacterium]